MTTAAVAVPLRAATSAPPSPFPSKTALALEQTPMHELERVFVRGATPEIEALIGWEFRGINHMPLNNYVPVAQIAGIKKFVKGFYRGPDGRAMGYNIGVERNALDGRWHLRPTDDAPNPYGYFQAAPVDPTARDNAYLHALLIDYSKGGNPALYPMNGLRDYLVQVDPANPDLFLGKAYCALGPVRIPTNFFILERHRTAGTEYVRR